MTAATIRRARRDDEASILCLWRQLVDHHRRIESVRPSAWSGPFEATVRPLLARLWDEPDRNAAFVAETEGEGSIVGFCRTALSDAGPCDATIATLVVDGGHRSEGLGGALLEAGLAWCRQRGARDISVDVLAPNAEAARFYEQRGFEPLLVTYVTR